MRIIGNLTRREFIKISLLGLSSLAFRGYKLPEFPQTDHLGRVNVGMTELKARPDSDSDTLEQVYGDTVVLWLRAVLGRQPWRKNQRWVGTPHGSISAPHLQAPST